jgi:hypothetical protein
LRASVAETRAVRVLLAAAGADEHSLSLGRAAAFDEEKSAADVSAQSRIPWGCARAAKGHDLDDGKSGAFGAISTSIAASSASGCDRAGQSPPRTCR